MKGGEKSGGSPARAVAQFGDGTIMYDHQHTRRLAVALISNDVWSGTSPDKRIVPMNDNGNSYRQEL